MFAWLYSCLITTFLMTVLLWAVCPCHTENMAPVSLHWIRLHNISRLSAAQRLQVVYNHRMLWNSLIIVSLFQTGLSLVETRQPIVGSDLEFGIINDMQRLLAGKGSYPRLAGEYPLLRQQQQKISENKTININVPRVVRVPMQWRSVIWLSIREAEKKSFF